MKIDPDSALYSALCPVGPSPGPPVSSLPSGSGVAVYDATFGAPRCTGFNIRCDSGTHLEQRGNNEANSPNTIDGCADGNDIYDATLTTESVKSIIVESFKPNSLRAGDLVNIKAKIIAKQKPDRLDFYYTTDPSATTVQWTHITSATVPIGETTYELPYSGNTNIQYTLPRCNSSTGCQQAVRVVFRSGRDGAQTTDGQHEPTVECPTGNFICHLLFCHIEWRCNVYSLLLPLSVRTGSYDDADDLVFDVLPGARPQDICNFQTQVTLNSNILCHGRECQVSTIRVVEVAPGVFYEYIRLPCVRFPFYSDPVKVFTTVRTNLKSLS